MTALPPAGWFPDPQAEQQWRWWDGRQWAPPGYGYAPQLGFDPAGRARWLAAHARTTGNLARWLRWVLVANAAGLLCMAVGIAIALRGGIHFPATDADGSAALPSGFVALQLFSIPANIASMAYLVLMIAWIYNAGKFAELQGWPRARDRVLGAFSLIIPIVNFWWPYEAVRDLFPPGARPAYLMRWWVSYLVVPISAFIADVIATIFAPLWVCCAVLVAVAAALAIPAMLGRRLVRDLDELHRRLLPASSST